MNEQIKQLAEQAGWMMGDEVEGFNTRLEKFAELIVRECADMIEEYQPRYLTRGQAREMADTIKENFGVEE